MDDHDELIERLQHLGRQPVDPAVQSAHLHAMASSGRSPFRSKTRIAGAFLAGLLVGGSGLAVAGALPDPAQDIAHDVFEQVGVQVPQPERYHGPECGAEVKPNHGGYVRDDKALAQSDCGKPVQAREGSADGDEGDPGAPRGGKGPEERGACQGPPPWATDRSMTPEEKSAAQAERRAACGTTDDADDDDDARDAVEEPATPPAAPIPPAPTTTTPDPATTTTVDGSTTSTEAVTTTTG